MSLFKMKWLALVATAAWQPLAAQAFVAGGEALMKKSDCFTCHSLQQKSVGPAYLDVAKKYRGNKAALAMLVKKVKDGGAGHWGKVPMSAHPLLSEADASAMVGFVLSLAAPAAKRGKPRE